jgi:hypothetical protein
MRDGKVGEIERKKNRREKIEIENEIEGKGQE